MPNIRVSAVVKSVHAQFRLAAFLVAASHAVSPGQSPPHMLPVGIWVSERYGFAWNVTSDKVFGFDLLAGQCLATEVRTPARFAADFGDWENLPDPKAERWRVITSGLAVEKRGQLPASCSSPLAPDTRPLVNFDYFWNTFLHHYPFFAAHRVDWNAVRKELRPQAAALPDNGDVFPLLSRMVTMLKDSHTGIRDGKRFTHVRKNPYPEEAGPNGPVLLDDHFMMGGLHAYLSGADSPLATPLATAGNGQILFGRLKPPPFGSAAIRQGDIGYVAFFGMKQLGKGETRDTPVETSVQSACAAMKEVVAALKGVRGLVIDIRYNGGGQDAVALAIAGFFTERPALAYTKQAYFKGKLTEPYRVTVLPAVGDRLAVPLVFLTSDMTVSAAEIFALALRALPATVQLGQPTRGALSDRLEKVLPNGWNFSLSNEVYKDPHGRVFEAVGVPPAVTTEWPSPKSPNAVRFQRDIDAAVRKLN